MKSELPPRVLHVVSAEPIALSSCYTASSRGRPVTALLGGTLSFLGLVSSVFLVYSFLCWGTSFWCFWRKSTWEACIWSPRMSGNVILPLSYLIDGLVECRILGWGSLTLRMWKVLLCYLPTSRDLIETSHTILIPNPFVKQLACSLRKILGFITGMLNFMRLCPGVNLFLFIVLDTWWARSMWRQLAFNLGTFFCIINLIISVLPFIYLFPGLHISWIFDLLEWSSIFPIPSVLFSISLSFILPPGRFPWLYITTLLFSFLNFGYNILYSKIFLILLIATTLPPLPPPPPSLSLFISLFLCLSIFYLCPVLVSWIQYRLFTFWESFSVFFLLI